MNRGAGPASEAARINSNLMAEASGTGLPAIKGVTDYARTGLNQGLPGFANRAYDSARTAGLEQSVADQQAARARIPGGILNENISHYVSPLVGAAGNLARENAGINLSKANATLTHRNQLLRTLSGQGAASTQLAVGFGGLTNRALASGLSSGDPTYEAVVGGGSVASTALLSLLAANRSSSGILGFNPNASGGYNPSLDAYQGGNGGTPINLTTRP